MKKAYLFVILGVLLIGIFSVFQIDRDEEVITIEKRELNDCEPIVKRGDSTLQAVERYEQQDCFKGYKLFLEKSE